MLTHEGTRAKRRIHNAETASREKPAARNAHPSGVRKRKVEVRGSVADANAQKMMDALKQSSLCPSMRRYDDKKDEKRVWKIRESGLGATAFVPGKPRTWEGWEDSAVDPKHLGNYLRDLRKAEPA